jgi:hypothetical protein
MATPRGPRAAEKELREFAVCLAASPYWPAVKVSYGARLPAVFANARPVK